MRSHAVALAAMVALTGSGLFAQQMKERAIFGSQPAFFVRAVALSPDGKLLASGGRGRRGNELTLWDTTTGKEVATLTDSSGSLDALAFSPDGTLLASGASRVPVVVWDVAARKQLVSLNGPGQWLAFTKDSSRLAAAGDRVVKVWDLKQAKELSSFMLPFRSRSMAFSPDLKTLAWPNYQEIELRDVATGREQALLSEHRGGVDTVAFSSDGSVLAAASQWGRYTEQVWTSSAEVKLWDVATARERMTLKAKLRTVYRLALSPDGKTLAVVDATDTQGAAELKLLDLTTGREVLRHKSTIRTLLAIAFAADGALFLVEYPEQKTLKLWELPRPKGE
jgi:WD40 repeat protein